MISVKIISTPEAMIRLRERGPFILQAVMRKMDALMIALQNKVTGDTIPRYFKSAPLLSSSVTMEKSRVEGTIIAGSVRAGAGPSGGEAEGMPGGRGTVKRTLGGPNSGKLVDVATIQEYGVDHPWEIQPVLYGIAQDISNRKRALSRSGLPEALKFMLDGKEMILRRVMHPPLAARPFMRTALQEMTPEIIAGLESAFKESLGG